jgi:hypothetical protein
MKKARGYSLYGLLGGPWSKGGLGFSLGMDTLRGKVRALGVDCPPSYNYTEWKAITEDILKQPRDTLIFMWGHSFGANALTWIAQRLNFDSRKVDYLAGYDPSVTTFTEQSVPLGANVRYALCVQGIGFSIPGHGRYSLTTDSKCGLAVVQKAEGHTDIDDDAGLHGRSLKTMRTLLGIAP